MTATTAPAPAGRSIRQILTDPDVFLGFTGAVSFTMGTYGLADIPRNDSTLADLGWGPLTYGHGKTLAWLLFWLGVALMVIAWVRLGRAIIRRTDDALDGRGAAVAVGAWAAPMLFAVPVFSRDVYAYLGQANVLAAGFDPYYDGPAHAPGPIVDSMAQIWAPTTSPYGPAFLLLMRGVVTISGDHVILGVFLTRLVLLPGLLLAMWALPRIAGHFGASRPMALWLLLLNPMLLTHLVAGPHIELLMMGFLAAGTAVALSGRPVAGLALLGLAASIKITAAVAIPFMFWVWLDQRRRASADHRVAPRTTVAVFAGTALVPAAVFGAFTAILGLGVGWINGLSWASRIINPFSIPTLVGHIVTYVAAPFQVWNLQEVLPVTRGIGSAVLAVLLVVIWWRFRRDERAAIAGAAWAMLAVLLLEPSTLPWYYVWTLVFAVAFDLPMWLRQLIVGVSVFFLITFQPDDSILFYKPVETLIALAFSILAAVSLRRRRSAPASRRRPVGVRPVTDPDVAAGYGLARDLIARAGRTYHLASLLLPVQRRRAVYALYGFARLIDDVVDDARGVRAATRIAELDAAERGLRAALDGRPADPALPRDQRVVLAALADSVHRFGIPTGTFDAFLHSMRMDVPGTTEFRNRYRTFDELAEYTFGSAAVIGHQLLPVLGVDADRTDLADGAGLLGIAFQHTNFLRDVAEDLARDRIYLPLDELAAFGVDEDLLRADAARRTAGPRLRAAVAHLVACNRDEYRRTAEAIAALPDRTRPAIAAAARSYGDILTEIEAADHDVLARRVVVPRRRRIGHAVAAAGGYRRTM